jgi:hypothetical protein
MPRAPSDCAWMMEPPPIFPLIRCCWQENFALSTVKFPKFPWCGWRTSAWSDQQSEPALFWWVSCRLNAPYNTKTTCIIHIILVLHKCKWPPAQQDGKRWSVSLHSTCSTDLKNQCACVSVYNDASYVKLYMIFTSIYSFSKGHGHFSFSSSVEWHWLSFRGWLWRSPVWSFVMHVMPEGCHACTIASLYRLALVWARTMYNIPVRPS